VIHDNCFISSHVVISGFCTVGENTFIGVNATFANNVDIGRDNWIGPAVTISQSTADGSLFKPPQPELARVSARRFFKLPEG
jgi:carbonic anhydrase/acetyltransferase-like protein (isoleucine patch superfamily)